MIVSMCLVRSRRHAPSVAPLPWMSLKSSPGCLATVSLKPRHIQRIALGGRPVDELEQKTSSTPKLTEFNPKLVPYQYQTIKLIRKEYDYLLGTLILLLSGSVGSAKTILGAHLAVTHALMNPGAGVLITRRTMGDLKATFWRVMLQHFPSMEQYWNKADMVIALPNGSRIFGKSYDDGNYEKFRSYELSFAVMEEAVEADHKQLFEEIMERLGRLPHIRENVFLLITNPDSPRHWIYEEIIAKQGPSVKVFFSRTEQNPFLPTWYIQRLKETLDPKRARRKLYGEWIEITQEVIYYNYNSEVNFKKGTEYSWDLRHPLCLAHDFNIGAGKPMSVLLGQCIDGVYHCAKTILVEGASTQAIMDEIADSGLLDLKFPAVWVHGDASGKHRDTRNNKSDYELIQKFLENFETTDGRKLKVEMRVPLSNPAIRSRQNTMNTLFKSEAGLVRFIVYSEAVDLDKGLRLTQFKKGATLVEDDGLREQHVTTAAGYWAHYNETTDVLQDIVIG